MERRVTRSVDQSSRAKTHPRSRWLGARSSAIWGPRPLDLLELVLGPAPDCPSHSQVLIIGGGDGGVLREVVKHSSVESVVQCEIDEVSALNRAGVWVQVPVLH